MERSLRQLVTLLAVVVMAASLMSCTDGSDEAIPATSTTGISAPEATGEVEMPGLTVPPGFVPPDTRGVRLTKVPSEPRKAPPAIKVYGGRASLHGVVSGPDGPVGDATVLLQRFVGSESGSVVVRAGGDGRWSATNLLGGRYRVRAWFTPTFAAESGQVIFLAADRGSGEVNLTLDRVEGRKLTAGVDLTEWSVGGNLKLRGLVTDNVVDEEGKIVGKPVADVDVRVDVTAKDVEVTTPATATTSANGIATWTLKCRTTGDHEVRLRAGDVTATLTLPPCSAATTSTTTVEVPEFPVGESFKVPYKGVLPAGSYITYNKDCQTSFQLLADDGWSSTRQSIKGDKIVLKTPARDFRAVDDSKPCEFQRSS